MRGVAGRGLVQGMTIVRLRDDDTDYALACGVNERGELVLSGAVRTLRAGVVGDEREYLYIVQASDVGRVCALLGADASTLLARVHDHLAPRGREASSAWRAWLSANEIPFTFHTWR